MFSNFLHIDYAHTLFRSILTVSYFIVVVVVVANKFSFQKSTAYVYLGCALNKCT